MSERAIVRVSADSMKKIRDKAKSGDVSFGEAADALILQEAPKRVASGDEDRVDPEQFAAIVKLAKRDKVSPSDMLAKLLRMGLSRHKALNNYAKSQAQAEG